MWKKEDKKSYCDIEAERSCIWLQDNDQAADHRSMLQSKKQDEQNKKHVNSRKPQNPTSLSYPDL